MQINCPRGCKRKGKPIPINTLKGFRRHMTYAHGGYTEDELSEAMRIAGEEATAAPASVPSSDTGAFNSFADRLPDVEGGEEPLPEPEAAPAPKSDVKTDAARSALNQKFNRIKKQLAASLPEAVDAVLADQGPEWALSKKETDMLTDAMESVFEMLDVKFQIEQFNVELKSRLWVLLYPLAVLLSIFAIKTAKFGKKKEEARADAANGTQPDTQTN